jgi:hypothetical protein
MFMETLDRGRRASPVRIAFPLRGRWVDRSGLPVYRRERPLRLRGVDGQERNQEDAPYLAQPDSTSAAGSAATTTSHGGEAHTRGMGINEFRVTHDDPSFFAAVRNRNMVRYGHVKRLDV